MGIVWKIQRTCWHAGPGRLCRPCAIAVRERLISAGIRHGYMRGGRVSLPRSAYVAAALAGFGLAVSSLAFWSWVVAASGGR